jgi:hypothetical protein
MSECFVRAAFTVLGTFYISSYANSRLPPLTLSINKRHFIGSESIPNFILAFIPAQINGDTLNTMTAFAVRFYPASEPNDVGQVQGD